MEKYTHSEGGAAGSQTPTTQACPSQVVLTTLRDEFSIAETICVTVAALPQVIVVTAVPSAAWPDNFKATGLYNKLDVVRSALTTLRQAAQPPYTKVEPAGAATVNSEYIVR